MSSLRGLVCVFFFHFSSQDFVLVQSLSAKRGSHVGEWEATWCCAVEDPGGTVAPSCMFLAPFFQHQIVSKLSLVVVFHVCFRMFHINDYGCRGNNTITTGSIILILSLFIIAVSFKVISVTIQIVPILLCRYIIIYIYSDYIYTYTYTYTYI